MNILFICSRNKWRSRTAEEIYKNFGIHQFRSAGTEKSARIRVNQNDLNWADQIFVMEQKHKKRLQAKFDLKNRNLIVLEIEDEYQFMDSELISILKASIDPYL